MDNKKMAALNEMDLENVAGGIGDELVRKMLERLGKRDTIPFPPIVLPPIA